jgi:hypothetical protein
MQTPGFGDSINVPKLKKGHLIFVEDVEMLYYIAKKGAGKSAALLEPGSVVEVHCVIFKSKGVLGAQNVGPSSEKTIENPVPQPVVEKAMADHNL